MRVLRQGMSGADVGAWQIFLTNRQLYSGDIHGEFEHLTDRATRSFQRLSELDADGIVGSMSLWAGLLVGFVPDAETWSPGFDTTRSVAKLASSAKTDGFRFVGRYHALAANAAKVMTADEVKALSDEGLRVVAVYQDRNNAPNLFNTAMGQMQAQRALDSAAAIRQPAGSAIYFAVDCDPRPAELPPILDYFRKIQEVFSANRAFEIGVYGSGLVCGKLRDAGIAKFTWLTGSTGFQGSTAFRDQADIIQILPERTLVSLDQTEAADIDPNIGRGADFGSFQI